MARLMAAMMAPAIGIDFGTSYSCVGVFYGDRVVIIENEWANRNTPSFVAFTEKDRLVGEAARNQLCRNPANTVFGAKRLLGRKANDPYISTMAKYWPFEVVGGEFRANIKVEYKEERRALPPEEICSIIVSQMKRTAEAFLGKPAIDAVVTMPAHFTRPQRQALVNACNFSGLNVLRIIDEATAAAIAYGTKESIKDETNVLVYNLGGGHLSISIVTIEDGLYEVRSKCGNSTIGGDDFTNSLTDYLVELFVKRYGRDITSNRKALSRLHKACELAKRELSSNTEADIELQSPMEGIDVFRTMITREKFEELNESLFYTTREPVKKALRDAKFDKGDIHEIVLVGGSTRIPKVQKLLQDLFNGKELNKSINPDEAVAYGAAVQAACLSQNGSLRVTLLDALPFSIGIETTGGEMMVLLKRNSTFPKVTSILLTTDNNNQAVLAIKLYEGDHILTKDNILLGKFAVIGILPAPRGVPQIQVTIDIDHNAALSVSAVNMATGREITVTVVDHESQMVSEGYHDIVPIIHGDHL